jgi:hypothetical protein
MAERKTPLKRVVEIDEVTILSVDKAVYDWFDKKHATMIKGRKVPVLFGAWERFAQMQGNKSDESLNAMRDHNGMLKLPIISIRRGDIEPDDERFRPVNAGGELSITVVKKIAESNFNNEQRVPFHNPYVQAQHFGNRVKKEEPVYEVQRLPWPDFIKVPYTITFWSSYVKNANQFHNMIWDDYQLNDLTYNGYFFYARFTSSSDESNAEDFSAEERIIRSSFTLDVQAYLINKDSIEFDRTPSKIVFEENVVGADEFEANDRTIAEILDGETVIYPL